MIAHGPGNVFYCGWGNLHRGGAADLYGLASHDRRLVGTDVGELDRPRRRWWPRFFRAETRRTRCTLKRVGPPRNHSGGQNVLLVFTVRVFLHDKHPRTLDPLGRSWEMTEPDKKGRPAP